MNNKKNIEITMEQDNVWRLKQRTYCQDWSWFKNGSFNWSLVINDNDMWQRRFCYVNNNRETCCIKQRGSWITSK